MDCLDEQIKTQLPHIYNQSSFYVDPIFTKESGGIKYICHRIYECQYISGSNTSKESCLAMSFNAPPTTIRYLYNPAKPHSKMNVSTFLPHLMISVMELSYNTRDHEFIFEHVSGKSSYYYYDFNTID